MTEYLDNTGYEAYSVKYMKQKLQAHFGDIILLSSGHGKECVVSLRNTAGSILYEFHKYQNCDNPDEEMLRIIKTAARLIENDIKSIITPKDTYPSIDNISCDANAIDYIPLSLQLFMKTMYSSKGNDLKLASIGQSLMQAVCPRAILGPLQLSLGVQMHHHFASRFLIDTLSEHGFSCSYAEVQRYERSAAVAHGSHTTTNSEDNFIQFIADNVDHNIATLDGIATFHGIGIIATITPKPQVCLPPIPKLQVTAEDIAAIGHINIDYFKIPSSIQSVTRQPIQKPQAYNPTSQLDIM